MPLLQEAARLANEAQAMEKRAAIFALRAALLDERFHKRLSSDHHALIDSSSTHNVYRRVTAMRYAERGLPIPFRPSTKELVSFARAVREQATQIKAQCRRTREHCVQQRATLQAAVESSRLALEMARSRMNAGRVLALPIPPIL